MDGWGQVWALVGEGGVGGFLIALCLGLGLAAATGLRAFLPLLIVAVLARFKLMGVDFGPNFAWLESNTALIALSAAVVAELVLDKIPAVDSAVDVVMTAVRPALAAVLVMASFSQADPAVAPILALIAAPVALIGHGAKAVTRPAVTATTGGLGNPVASVAEDGWAVVLTGLALLAPLLVPLAILLSIWILWRVMRALGRRLRSLHRRAGETFFGRRTNALLGEEPGRGDGRTGA